MVPNTDALKTPHLMGVDKHAQKVNPCLQPIKQRRAPEMKVVDLQSDYKVVDTRNVSLSIRIGDAQIGSSIVFLDDKEIGRGDVADLSLGKGSKIKNKSVKVKSVVTDVNDMTNKTSITYIFKGGVLDQSFSSNATVDENGDSIIYRGIFSIS
jgi:hypothetical protein